jgi:hypothetical protein
VGDAAVAVEWLRFFALLACAVVSSLMQVRSLVDGEWNGMVVMSRMQSASTIRWMENGMEWW